MSTLYELTGRFLELLEMIQQGEIEEETFNDTLESLDFEIEIKADGYAKIIKEVEGNVNTIKAEIERLSKKKSSLDNIVKRMKLNLEESMRITGKTKFKTDLFSFGIQKNGGKQPLDIYDEVPEEYSLIKIEPDKDKIRTALENGQELPFAILQERGESLRIR